MMTAALVSDAEASSVMSLAEKLGASARINRPVNTLLVLVEQDSTTSEDVDDGQWLRDLVSFVRYQGN